MRGGALGANKNAVSGTDDWLLEDLLLRDRLLLGPLVDARLLGSEAAAFCIPAARWPLAMLASIFRIMAEPGSASLRLFIMGAA